MRGKIRETIGGVSYTRKAEERTVLDVTTRDSARWMALFLVGTPKGLMAWSAIFHSQEGRAGRNITGGILRGIVSREVKANIAN